MGSMDLAWHDALHKEPSSELAPKHRPSQASGSGVTNPSQLIGFVVHGGGACRAKIAIPVLVLCVLKPAP